MDWIIARLRVLPETLEAKRVLLLPLIFSVFALAANYSGSIWRLLTGKDNAAMLLGAPPWTWGTMAVLVLMWGLAIEYAYRLRLKLTPKIKPSFEQNEEGVSFAVERVFLPAEPPTEIRPLDFKATYVRFRVEVLTSTAVRDCAAHITGVRKWSAEIGAFGDNCLPHTMQVGEPQFDVLPRVHRMVAFLRSNEDSNKLTPTVPWPFHLEHFFDDPGIYRFSFEVTAEDVSESLYVDVHWRGQWNTITAEQVLPNAEAKH